MNGVKSTLASKGVWGGIIVVLGLAANFFGYSIAPADQQAMVDAVSKLMELFGGLLAIYGRITASKKIAK